MIDKELLKLCRIMRKNGIKRYKCAEYELEIEVNYQFAPRTYIRRSVKPKGGVAEGIPVEEKVVDEPTDEDWVYYSAK